MKLVEVLLAMRYSQLIDIQVVTPFVNHIDAMLSDPRVENIFDGWVEDARKSDVVAKYLNYSVIRIESASSAEYVDYINLRIQKKR